MILIILITAFKYPQGRLPRILIPSLKIDDTHTRYLHYTDGGVLGDRLRILLVALIIVDEVRHELVYYVCKCTGRWGCPYVFELLSVMLVFELDLPRH